MASDTSPVCASLWCQRCARARAQIACQQRHSELPFQEKTQLTKYRIRLAILLRRVGANQRTEIEIGNLLLVSVCVRRVCVRFAIEAGRVRREEGQGTHALINVRQRSLPSSLFIQSSSSVAMPACGAAANSGKSRTMCSNISSSYL